MLKDEPGYSYFGKFLDFWSDFNLAILSMFSVLLKPGQRKTFAKNL